MPKNIKSRLHLIVLDLITIAECDEAYKRCSLPLCNFRHPSLPLLGSDIGHRTLFLLLKFPLKVLPESLAVPILSYGFHRKPFRWHIIVVLDGYFEIIISLSMHAVNLKSFRKKDSWNKHNSISLALSFLYNYQHYNTYCRHYSIQ